MLTNTGQITIKGIQIDSEQNYTEHNMIVRFTSDELGETISISRNDELMLVVPFEPVARLIKNTRAKKDAKKKKRKLN